MGKVAVVTGSNRGIGFGCVRALCKHFKQDGVVYLTSRKEEDGKKAVADLEKEGLNPRYHQLDISNQQSVEALRDHLKKEHGGLDILINNAAMAFKMNDSTPNDVQAKVCNQVNYFDTAQVYTIMSPILRPHARVVNVASLGGLSAFKRIGEGLKEEFKKAATAEAVDELVNNFIQYTAAGENEKYGYTPGTNYGFSKLALITLTRIQNREVQKDATRPGICVFSVCPGHVSTAMSNYTGKTSDEGADTIVWLSLQPQDTTVAGGEFYSDRKVFPIFSSSNKLLGSHSPGKTAKH